MAKIDNVLVKYDKCDHPNYQAIASEFGIEKSILSKYHCNKTGSKEAQYESVTDHGYSSPIPITMA
jgi:hypothetical protein